MPIDYNSLQTLLGLQSPTNLSPGSDPWLAQRRSDIYSGLDEWLPDADSADFRRMQVQTPGAYSRDQMRSSAMSLLRQKLGLGAVQHQQQMEEAQVAPRITGEYGLRERQMANQGALDVERERGQAARDAAESKNQALLDMLGLGIVPSRISGNGVSVSTGKTAQKSTPPTQGQTKALNDARAGYQGGMSRLQRTLGIGNGGRDTYLNALNDVLVRSGSSVFTDAQEAKKRGMSLADVMAFAQSQGVQYNPYEQEYLQLTLGE